MSDFTLRRYLLGDTTTLGILSAGDERLCFVLEDRFRPHEAKVPGRTAIPLGRYRVEVTWSPKFKQDMPLLWNELTKDGRKLVVSADGKQRFEGIRLHTGKTHEHTEGCVLVGLRAETTWPTPSGKKETLRYALDARLPPASGQLESVLGDSPKAYAAVFPLFVAPGEHWLSVELA